MSRLIDRLTGASRPVAKWSRKTAERLARLDMPSVHDVSHEAADLAGPTLANARRAVVKGFDEAGAALADYTDSTARWARPVIRRARHALDVGATAALPIMTDGPAVAAKWAAPVARRTATAMTRGAALALPVLAGASHAVLDRAGPALDRTRRALRRPSPGVLLGLGAAALGAAVAANLILARRAEHRHPARGRFIEVDGVRLHYLEKGQGQPIVLLHGNGVSAEDFVVSGLFDALARTHRVIALDRPGFGYSSRPRARIWTPGRQAALIAKALAALNVRRPVVVGHSLGALVALNLGLDHAEDVAGLVLMSGFYRPTPRLDSALAVLTAVPVVGDLLRWTLAPLHARLMAPLAAKKLFAPAEPTVDFKSRFSVGLASRPSQLRASAADAVLMVPGAAAISGRVDQLRMPVLVMGGTGDQIVDFADHSRSLAGRLQTGELKAFDEVGHMMHHLAPQETAAAVEAFANRYQARDQTMPAAGESPSSADPIPNTTASRNGDLGAPH